MSHIEICVENTSVHQQHRADIECSVGPYGKVMIMHNVQEPGRWTRANAKASSSTRALFEACCVYKLLCSTVALEMLFSSALLLLMFSIVTTNLGELTKIALFNCKVQWTYKVHAHLCGQINPLDMCNLNALGALFKSNLFSMSQHDLLKNC